jgi:DNA-binding response OmpR family regulator
MARILVIDDQKDVRSVISIVLRVNRFEVVEAANAAEGLRAFEEGHFDAAIVDVFLDDAIGFDVIAKMRASVPDLPVIAVSGMVSLDMAPQGEELPNVACLKKPFRPSELIAAITAAQEAARSAQVANQRVAAG